MINMYDSYNYIQPNTLTVNEIFDIFVNEEFTDEFDCAIRIVMLNPSTGLIEAADVYECLDSPRDLINHENDIKAMLMVNKECVIEWDYIHDDGIH